MLIICDHRDMCGDIHCTWRRPSTSGSEMLNALCNTANKTVNVHKVHELEDSNPNYKFMRKKNGL